MIGEIRACVFAMLVAGSLQSQQARTGRVVDSTSGAPLADATVVTVQSGERVNTDRLGQFTLSIRPGDRLVVSRIGYRPDTVAVESPDSDLLVRLRRIAYLDPIITVTSMPGQQAGTWRLTPEIVRQAPPAVEPDLLRATERLIAVSFSSPFSARPILRGVDPGQSQVQVDGFPVLNPYHIGRAFAAFVPEGVADVQVQAGGMGLESSDAVGGVIDVRLAEGRRDSLDSGLGLSPGTLRGWHSGGASGTRWGAAGRFLHLGAGINVLPYTMYEGHGAVVLERGLTRIRFTGYGSHDALRDDGSGDTGGWSNLVTGIRVDRPLGSALLTGRAFYSRFVERIEGLGEQDADNDFTSGGASLNLRVPLSSVLLAELGGDLGVRRIENRIGAPTLPLRAFSQTALRGGGLAALRIEGPVSITGGVRYDQAGNHHAIQPRVAAQVQLSRRFAWSGAAGRYTQFYHMIGDPSGDPDVAFYDFWLSADEPDVGPQRANHFLSDLTYRAGSESTIRVSGYALALDGVLEYQPRQRTFRRGRARSRGASLEIANVPVARGALRLGAAYVLAWSERDWGDGWLPWINDHRHMIRTWGSWRAGRRWRVNWFLGAASPEPTELIYGTVARGVFRPYVGMFVRAPDALGGRQIISGGEASGRGWWTQRGDLSAEYTFGGFGRTEWSLGFSILNATIGRIAPAEVFIPNAPLGEPRRIEYRQRYELPPIPTVTVTVRF